MLKHFALIESPRKAGEITKKKSDSKPTRERFNDLRSEYRFDYRKAKPNRFAKRLSADTSAVVPDPDVAAVFKSSKAVNNLLRSIIAAYLSAGCRS